MQFSASPGRVVATAADDVRVQYRLDMQEGPTGVGDGTDTRIGVVVDVETTGGNAALGSIIEMAVRRFRFDRTGVVTHVDRVYRWREDPGMPIPPNIVAITGITDEDVAGRRIDDEEAARLLRSASIVIAHNAALERPWIESRLTDISDLAWGCSMTQIDWRAHGFDGLALGYLLRQAGWFHEPHHADADVDAVLQLLRHSFDDQPALAALITTAMRPSWTFRAVGAALNVEGILKKRGYRWDAERRVWSREVSDDDRIAEEFWLAANVYAVPARARAIGPEVQKITARTRFR